MAWLQLHCYPQKQQIEAITDYMNQQGSLAITYTDAADEPMYEPKPNESTLWQQTKLTALFQDEIDISAITKKLQHQFPDLHYTTETLEEQNWTRAWMDDFKPMCFGERTWIIPSNHQNVDDAAINILLDPGMAFGTGTHPTTALCLQWIDQHELKDKTVIDYGCGSGILAIAAKKHGAANVYAIDYDPQALTATSDNAAMNQVELTVLAPDSIANDLQVDMLIANIIVGPLLELQSTFSQLLRPQGQLVLSGILPEQVELLLAQYRHDFEQFTQQQQQDWVRVTAIRSCEPR